MRHLLTVAALAALTAAAPAADDKPAPKPGAPAKPADDAEKPEEKPSLGIGDPAPPLKVTKWLKGTEVTAFAAGKVYVVEFWATWCGPCLVMMPHVSAIQEEYRDKGVTVVGFTKSDPNNGADKVAEFVEKRGAKLKYTFAYADDRETSDAYMKAAGRNGIRAASWSIRPARWRSSATPCCSARCSEGGGRDVNGKADAADVEKATGELQDVMKATRGKDVDGGLKALAAFAAKRPSLAKSLFIGTTKLGLLLKAKRFDGAKAEAEAEIAEALKANDGVMLVRIAAALAGPDAKGRKPLAELAMACAETAVKVNGETDIGSVLMLADSKFAAGDVAGAKAIGVKVLGAVDPRARAGVEARVKKYDIEEKKDD